MVWGVGTDGAAAAGGDDTGCGGRGGGVPRDGEPGYQQRAERPARDAAARPRVDRQARLCSLDRGAADERIALLSDPGDQRPGTHDRRLARAAGDRLGRPDAARRDAEMRRAWLSDDL